MLCHKSQAITHRTAAEASSDVEFNTCDVPGSQCSVTSQKSQRSVTGRRVPGTCKALNCLKFNACHMPRSQCSVPSHKSQVTEPCEHRACTWYLKALNWVKFILLARCSPSASISRCTASVAWLQLLMCASMSSSFSGTSLMRCRRIRGLAPQFPLSMSKLVVFPRNTKRVNFFSQGI